MPELSRKEEAERAQAARRRASNVHRLRPRVGDVPASELTGPPAAAPAYAELHSLTHFSFQRGASSPEELVRRAWALGYTALAITDECSVAGVVRAWGALKTCARAPEPGDAWDEDLLHARAARQAAGLNEPLQLLYGSEFRFEGQGTLVAIARDLESWGDLCSFITACRRAAPKGEYRLPPLADALAALRRCERLLAPDRSTSGRELVAIQKIADCARQSSAAGYFDTKSASLHLLTELHARADDALWLARLRALSEATGCPLVAAGDVHMHVRSRKRLHDVMTAIRVGKPVHACGFELQANAERHLRPRARLGDIFPPDVLAATLAVARRCTFRLEEVQYNYPQEAVIQGLTPTETLRRLTLEGAAQRYPKGVPRKIWRYVAKELKLIAECRYEMFFLTVHDIVRFAKGEGILCQGRGSAANSVVCWCLGITAADPEKSHPLLERFISKSRRDEPPDIDVDFEHERRETVIQYIYEKYGHDRAALAATVICYRTRSALRDAGEALGVDERLIDAFAKDHHWFDEGLAAHRLGELASTVGASITPEHAQLWLEMTQQLRGRPRHLSQHVGGFVLTETPLKRLVPIENAAMKDRRVIQWEKDDLEALGMMKVDVLALGMLTAMRRCIELVERRRGEPFARSDIQSECPETYAMIRRADTVGTFQIESRAQMSMLPRLKPTTFYDLVVQVAIVRPGPISGGMVHPYLKARERWARDKTYECERSSKEPPDAEPALDKALRRTLGIPIFQEQVMEIAIIAAGFSAERADQLRRSMAAWKRHGGVHKFEAELKDGMRARGYSDDFAGRIFNQILGFGEYGFPESHAYSFALIAYESSWLKCHEPEAFLAAMLNSQPMGFYGPAQLVQDAKRHRVVVLPPDVAVSDWDCALESPPADLDVNPKTFSSLAGRSQSAIDSGARTPSPEMRERVGVRGLPSPSPAGRGLGWGLTTSAGHAAGPHPNLPPAGEGERPRPAVRLGLRLVQGLNEETAHRIEHARVDRAFASVDDLARRAALDVKALNQLAAADALCSLAGHRRQQVWQGAALKSAPELLRDAPIDEAPLELPAAPEGEEIVHDYAALGLTLRRHPVALLRPRLARLRLKSADELKAVPHGEQVRACGIVIGRQQPGTAKGTIFVTLEDETGPVNVIVWKSLRADEQQRNALLRSRLLAVQGEWQRDQNSGGQVAHLIAQRFVDLTPLLGRIAGLTTSRDFH
jgi:error-prone DNA polymerase